MNIYIIGDEIEPCTETCLKLCGSRPLDHFISLHCKIEDVLRISLHAESHTPHHSFISSIYLDVKPWKFSSTPSDLNHMHGCITGQLLHWQLATRLTVINFTSSRVSSLPKEICPATHLCNQSSPSILRYLPAQCKSSFSGMSVAGTGTGHAVTLIWYYIWLITSLF